LRVVGDGQRGVAGAPNDEVLLGGDPAGAGAVDGDGGGGEWSFGEGGGFEDRGRLEAAAGSYLHGGVAAPADEDALGGRVERELGAGLVDAELRPARGLEGEEQFAADGDLGAGEDPALGVGRLVADDELAGDVEPRRAPLDGEAGEGVDRCAGQVGADDDIVGGRECLEELGVDEAEAGLLCGAAADGEPAAGGEGAVAEGEGMAVEVQCDVVGAREECSHRLG
jgi:hypothetical protein